MPVLQQGANLDEAPSDPRASEPMVRGAGNRRLFYQGQRECRAGCACDQGRGSRIVSPDGAEMARAGGRIPLSLRDRATARTVSLRHASENSGRIGEPATEI